MSSRGLVGEVVLSELQRMAGGGAGFYAAAPVETQSYAANVSRYIVRDAETIRRGLFAAKVENLHSALDFVRSMIKTDLEAVGGQIVDYGVVFESGALFNEYAKNSEHCARISVAAKKKLARNKEKFAPAKEEDIKKMFAEEVYASEANLRAAKMPSEDWLIASNTDAARDALWTGVNGLICHAFKTFPVKEKTSFRFFGADVNGAEKVVVLSVNPGDSLEKVNKSALSFKIDKFSKDPDSRMIYALMTTLRNVDGSRKSRNESATLEFVHGTFYCRDGLVATKALLAVPSVIPSDEKMGNPSIWFHFNPTSDDADEEAAAADDQDADAAAAAQKKRANAKKLATPPVYMNLFGAFNAIAKNMTDTKDALWTGVSNPIATLDVLVSLVGGVSQSLASMNPSPTMKAGMLLRAILSESTDCANPLRENHCVQVEHFNASEESVAARLLKPRRCFVDEHAMADVFLRIVAWRMSRRCKGAADIFTKVCRFLDENPLSSDETIQGAIDYMRMREERNYALRSAENEKAEADKLEEIKVWEKQSEEAWKEAYPSRGARPARKPMQKKSELSHEFRPPKTAAEVRRRVRRCTWRLVCAINCHVAFGEPFDGLLADAKGVWGGDESVELYNTHKNLIDAFFPAVQIPKTETK